MRCPFLSKTGVCSVGCGREVKENISGEREVEGAGEQESVIVIN
jgi:hypothetical protein